LKKELSKTYDPSNIETKWYEEWETSKAFMPNEGDDTFTLMIPPPNVTGILHIGHVLNNTIQDVLVRHARMLGKNTLWLPGTDHASIATEAKVTKLLASKGIDKKEIGREEFLKHCWDWTEKYGGIIIKQLKRLGNSCDWTKQRFTMDEAYYDSVIETFISLYNEGLIYQGTRMVNWDCTALTAVSDEEVIYKEEKGFLWHIKYQIKDSDKCLIVATTRPETMLGDTGVAVNPKDKRYKHFIGKSAILPIINREIPIFGDEYVDMEFGTGCVKITPAHDPNDYEMGIRHKLDSINILNPNGTCNENVPNEFVNKNRFEVRKIVVEMLDNLQCLDKIEDYIHKVGHSERTNDIIEPRLSKQWFLKMEDLVKPALEVVKNKKIKFYPPRWEKIYNHWLNNIQDWCISRQLWWGHRIPIWYKDDTIYCGKNPPDDSGWTQDEDVLDTWFSSWIWPMGTLGWPHTKDELKKFYPTQDLVTGPDIIFFWVARMIISGTHFAKEIPFSNVYFTSIIRDNKGRKMSKSLGNSPDPIELFDKYGVDAVRSSILMISPQGSDVLFSEEKIELGRNFMNKLWNCSRFLLMNIEDEFKSDLKSIDLSKLDNTDIWIISKLHRTINEINNLYDDYKLNEIIKTLYNFVWKDYCDWYIEFSKSRFYGLDDEDREICKSVSVYLLENILKLLHPYTPYITEEIWSCFEKKEMLITSSWPKFNKEFLNTKLENNITFLMEVISSIRNIKIDLGISPKKKIDIFSRAKRSKSNILIDNNHHLSQLVNIENIYTGKDIDKPNQSATIVAGGAEIFIPLGGLIDISKEIDRLQQKMEDLKFRIDNVKKKLDNKNFVDRAPKNIIEHEENKYKSYMEDFNKLKNNFDSLSPDQA